MLRQVTVYDGEIVEIVREVVAKSRRNTEETVTALEGQIATLRENASLRSEVIRLRLLIDDMRQERENIILDVIESDLASASFGRFPISHVSESGR